MNIKEAKAQIKNAMTAYFSKDTFGNYEIPMERQRPIFLIGEPGIGKTAIMEQIAKELGVNLVSYSMTHHTRQSALGLPFIVQKKFEEVEYSVSEYTMSEIIASVYDMIELTHIKEGILFLDEINCVSETLTPSMLQFLQFKFFGRHRVPDGWIVVTAGNPPEYNKSVREFDIVTMDRLKQIRVEPDFDVWKEYAYQAGIHRVVLTYLEIKNSHFYKVETTAEGKRFVTARGWDDLSQMIKLYEKHGITVDEKLIEQYIQHPKISKDFAAYYDLFDKYKSDYQIQEILSGNATAEIKQRSHRASFDERVSLIGLLAESITVGMREVTQTEAVLLQYAAILKHIKQYLTDVNSIPAAVIDSELNELKTQLDTDKKANNLSDEKIKQINELIVILNEQRKRISVSGEDRANIFKILRRDIDRRLDRMMSCAGLVKTQLDNLFVFFEEVFPEGRELLILVTELTVNKYSSAFISRHGCPKYFEYNKELLFYERKQEITAALDAFNLDALSAEK
jgi:MoxR-like ATPase